MSEQLKVRDRNLQCKPWGPSQLAAYFPRNVVDNMVKYDASHYNDDLGRVSYVSDIIANMIAYQSGHTVLILLANMETQQTKHHIDHKQYVGPW